MSLRTLAIDFGTSNSAAAIPEGPGLRRVPLEPGSDTIPTAVFFRPGTQGMLVGSAANEALIAGEEGRYMRAIKSVLGTELMHEKRPIGGRRQTLSEVVTAFLIKVKSRAEAVTGQQFDGVLSGRPVRFHSADAQRDQQAEADLRACYEAAGFSRVTFRFEPEAAALTSHAAVADGRIGLVVDIGGGTSDFTVFRRTGASIEVLASHGIRLGGTNFDHAVSVRQAMPLLGRGGQLRREMGAGLVPVPNAIYSDLATWEKIPFVYGPKALRDVRAMERLAVEPRRLARLGAVIEHETGHSLAFAVEAGKIAANGAQAGAHIDMHMVEAGLIAPISPDALAATLAPFGPDLRAAALAPVAAANLVPSDVGCVIFVGGSSLMRLVVDEMQAAFPTADVQQAAAFTAVVDGLALAVGQMG